MYCIMHLRVNLYFISIDWEMCSCLNSKRVTPFLNSSHPRGGTTTKSQISVVLPPYLANPIGEKMT